MISSNNIAERHQEIQFLIAGDDFPQAVKRLMDFARDFSQDKDDINDVIVISATYNRLEKHERRGTLVISEIEQQRNQLLYKALGLLDAIVEQISFDTADAA